MRSKSATANRYASAAKIRCSMKPMRLRLLMDLTTGRKFGTNASKVPNRPDTPPPESSATKTSILMEDGRRCPPAAPSGFRRRFRPDGPPTAMATGRTSLPGDGPGLTMHLGDSHHFITVAGFPGEAAGDGLPVR